MSRSYKIAALGLLVIVVAFLAGCAPGPNSRFVNNPAGFWAGLWHGLICVVTFIISLFTDNVQMYEVNNNGGWYNLGFLLGVCIFFCGGWGTGCKKRRQKSYQQKEWEEIGDKLEEKIRKGIKEWLDESEKKDADWEEIGRKIEEKIKRELRDWTEMC